MMRSLKSFLTSSSGYIQSRRYLPYVILIVSMIIFLLLVLLRSRPAAQQLPEKAWNVSVIAVKRGTHHPTLVLHGVTESPRRSTIEAAVTADVIETPVKEGTLVKKNQLLIKLDDRETQFLLEQRSGDVNELKAKIEEEIIRGKNEAIALEHEKALLAIRKRNVERQLTLVKKKVGSEAALDEARERLREQSLQLTDRELSVKNHENRLKQLRSQLRRAVALRKQAELDLSRTQIKAPFDGRIAKLNVSVGNRVQPGENLIELFDLKEVEVRAQIPSHYVSVIHNALKQDQPLTATAELDATTLKLELKRLAGEVASGRGGVDGLFIVDESDNHLALGRSLEILLKLPPITHSIAIPPEALYGRNRIYIVKNQRMQALIVQRLGIIQHKDDKKFYLITSPELKKNDKIITTQLPNARTGLRVQIVDTDE